jgi:hypothetical protein
MASFPVTRHFATNQANLLVMPDPKQAALATCSQLAKEIAVQCPKAKRQCDQLIFWLDVVERASGLQSQAYETGRDYSQCKNIYEAMIEVLKAHGEPMTEAEMYEALIAGNAPGSTQLKFRDNFRRAVSNTVRKEIEVQESETGERLDNILRLSPDAAKIPPKKAR